MYVMGRIKNSVDFVCHFWFNHILTLVKPLSYQSTRTPSNDVALNESCTYLQTYLCDVINLNSKKLQVNFYII